MADALADLDAYTAQRMLEAIRAADVAEVERVVAAEGLEVLLRPLDADSRRAGLASVCALRVNPRERRTLESWVEASFGLGISFPADALVLKALLANTSFDVARRVQFLQEFVERGVDVNTPIEHSECVYGQLMCASETELRRAVLGLEISEAARADAVVAGLHRVAYGSQDTVERALAAIAECSSFGLPSRVMPSVLPLHAAALSGSRELLEALLERGADVQQELPESRQQRLLLRATSDPRGNGALIHVSAGLSAVDAVAIWRRGLEDAAAGWGKSKKRDPEGERRAHYLEFCNQARQALLERGAVPTPQTLTGLTLLVTGELAGYPGDAAERRLERLGARIAGGVSNKLSALLCGEKPGASKLKKAKTLGIPLVGHTEALQVLAGRPW